MPVKTSGYGVVFEFDPLGGVAYQVITSIVEINPPGIVKTTIDVTTHDSPGAFEELRRNKIKRSEDIEFIIIYDPAEASHIALKAAVEDDDDSVIPACRFTFPPDVTKVWEFDAIFLGFAAETPMEDDPMISTITIHPTGAIVEV